MPAEDPAARDDPAEPVDPADPVDPGAATRVIARPGWASAAGAPSDAGDGPDEPPRDGPATARLPLPGPVPDDHVGMIPRVDELPSTLESPKPGRPVGPPAGPRVSPPGPPVSPPVSPSVSPPPERPADLYGPPPRGAARRIGDALQVGMMWARRILVCTAIVAVMSPLIVAFRVWYVARQDSTPRSDAVIVLGAAQYNGVPSPVFQWRLRHAARLYREGVAPVVVTVGGGQPGDRYTEAVSGRRWLAEHGVPAGKVVAVGTGRDTQESMVAVGKEFRRRDWRSAVLVSDPWHALRTRTMARDQGIEAATSPTRSGPIVQTRGTQARYIIRETGAYLAYIIDGKG
jgi:uncharacterized SAM-binding protein YcdF (DUF218 family)